MRYLLKFSYDGSNFAGFQCQNGLRTVQGIMEDVASKINNGMKTNIVSTGRTDKGVHALCQFAHVDFAVSITPYQVKRAMNSYLPEDIHVIDVSLIPSSFHVRYKTRTKTYQYRINTGEYNPLRRNYCYQHNYPLDVVAMNAAIKYFIGVHDFRAFVTESKERDNCVREIMEAFIERDSFNGELVITFKGNGFLRYQVRNMVGTLLKVGTGKISPTRVKEILDSKVRGKDSATAKACGLYLCEVELLNDDE